MTVQTSGSFTSVLPRQSVEPTPSASFWGEKPEKSQNGKEKNRQVRKQSSKRQQNDRACHIFFFVCWFVCFRFYIRKIGQCERKAASLRRSPGRLPTLRSASLQIFLQLALQKYQGKKKSSLFRPLSPPRSRRQIVVCSVSHANKTAADK